jgi:hypothetical protein
MYDLMSFNLLSLLLQREHLYKSVQKLAFSGYRVTINGANFSINHANHRLLMPFVGEALGWVSWLCIFLCWHCMTYQMTSRLNMAWGHSPSYSNRTSNLMQILHIVQSTDDRIACVLFLAFFPPVCKWTVPQENFVTQDSAGSWWKKPYTCVKGIVSRDWGGLLMV